MFGVCAPGVPGVCVPAAAGFVSTGFAPPDGAHFRGSIDMKTAGGAGTQPGSQGQTAQASMPGAQTSQAKPAAPPVAGTAPGASAGTPGEQPKPGQPQQTTLPNPTTGSR